MSRTKKKDKSIYGSHLILAALLTSPSPVDQILLAVPMWLLYELGLLLAYMTLRKKTGPDEL